MFLSAKKAMRRTNMQSAEVAVERPRISYWAVGRHDQKHRGATQQLRVLREFPSRMVADLGSTPVGQMGHLLAEMIRVISFCVTAAIQEAGLDRDALPAIVK